MNIVLIVAEHGYSFVNQAEALMKGLKQIGVNSSLVKVSGGHVDASQLQEARPDIVISVGDWHDYAPLVEAPMVAGFVVVPWVVADEASDLWIEQYNKLPLILVPSQHVKEQLTSNKVTDKLIEVLPEAVDDDLWKPWEEKRLVSFLELLSVQNEMIRADLPKRFDLMQARQEGVPIIFTTGGYATAKGAQEVMRALATLEEDLPWIYVIKTWPAIESLKYTQEELTLAEELGLADRMRYIIGEFSRDFKVGLMNACDMYASPSRHEGFGLPLVEAQMCGKPVVTVAGTATQETVRDGVTGFLATRDTSAKDMRADVSSLAGHLRELLTNTDRRAELGRQALKLARATYRPAAITRRLLNTLAKHKLP
ncbi:MAG: glycosyltransferase family 4 protein [Candidatus Binatia bacterium]|nr:glycosyltransferase family 4 protein [Candidatus Binatia bacterium]